MLIPFRSCMRVILTLQTPFLDRLRGIPYYPSIHLRLPLSRIIDYLWMRTAIASRATGNVHVQLESGWLVSRVLDFVKAIGRVAGCCAIVEETACRTDGGRRGGGGGRVVSRDRRGGRHGSCSCTGDRATPRHTDVQRCRPVRPRVGGGGGGGGGGVARGATALRLIHGTATLLFRESGAATWFARCWCCCCWRMPQSTAGGNAPGDCRDSWVARRLLAHVSRSWLFCNEQMHTGSANFRTPSSTGQGFITIFSWIPATDD